MENSMAIPEEKKAGININSVILLLGTYPKALKTWTRIRYLHIRVHHSIIHKSPKMEAPQVSILR